jgi:DNA-binding NtrC family response regulator
MLQRHSWPGNVRELEHTIKRAVLLAKGDTLSVHDVQLESAPVAASGAPVEELRKNLRQIANRWVARGAPPDGESPLYADAVGTLETALIEAALGITQGNRAAAAKMLGINRATLRNKLPDGEPPE